MEMDGATLVVLIISVTLLVTPFVLDHRRRSRSSARLIGLLRDAVQHQKYELHAHEILNDMAIGMDKVKKVLFLLDQSRGMGALQQVQLAQFKGCEAIKTARRGKEGQSDGPVERVELCFRHMERKSDVRLVLYRNEIGSPLNGEVQFAESWAGMVNDVIKK